MYTLLFTNDLHNHLNPAQAAYLRQMRAALGGRGLMLDAGDAVGSGNVTFRPGGELILRTMNDIGYDAMTVGNREFHITRYGFQSKIGLARFPILCANIRPSKHHNDESDNDEGGDADWKVHAAPGEDLTAPDVSRDRVLPDGKLEGSEEGRRGERQDGGSDLMRNSPCPFLVHDLEGDATRRCRIVIVGLTVPMVTERMLARKVSAYVFDDPLAVAARLVPQLRTRYAPDLMVALTHIGIAQDRRLALEAPGIDLIIGGHTHVVLAEGERVGRTLIAQAGSHGRYLGRVNISLTQDASQQCKLTASLSPLPKVPSPAFISAQVQALQQALQNETT